MKSKIYIILSATILLYSCNSNSEKADAYGNFEATEILISAESNGTIKSLKVQEGDLVKKDQQIGYIDTIQLHLKQEQLKATIKVIKSKLQSVQPHINVLLEKKANFEREYKRLLSLNKDGAATQKQLDDMQGQIDVVTKQIEATKSQLNTQNRGLLSEIEPLQIQIAQIKDQVQKSKIIMPQTGHILTKYAEEGEFTNIGKPLLKLADLSVMDLRIYVSENQLSRINLGQEVEVNIDTPESMKSYQGKISWISAEAEFTPKIVQTKEERVNLVYAVKVKVKNDGGLKIGIPAEVNFNNIQN